MTDASSDWAHRPVPASFPEGDSVSSQTADSAESGQRVQRNLATAFDKLNLAAANMSRSFDEWKAQESSLDTGVSDRNVGEQESKKKSLPLIPPPPKPFQLKPLQLMDLPLDILKCIIKEVTHTNDLTALALTCSILHNLTIPHMYSRFDIVWPESLNSTPDDYAGVDALSYGLSTLVMGEDVFHPPPLPGSDGTIACSHCGCNDPGHHSAYQSTNTNNGIRSRRGNYYAQYTRIFSIGNGPLGWVQEYSVNREVGKMLGTLVALAVARMINLESFIWDMPTGVVREVWFALASLANRPNHDCRLERIWVRWHDNMDNSVRSLVAPLSTTGGYLQMYKGVEHPSLSVLPPLKSVTVLDIDEPAYVEELAVLIDRSRRRLTELRIGIAAKCNRHGWIRCQKNQQAMGFPGPWPKSGGVLSILSKNDPEARMGGREWLAGMAGKNKSEGPIEGAFYTEEMKTGDLQTQQNTESPPGPQTDAATTHDESSKAIEPPHTGDVTDDDKLNLEVLELERIPLCIPNLLPTIDWTRLTTLTLMQCHDHENLWRALRRKYAPPDISSTRRQSEGNHQESSKATNLSEYPLNIKHLRTDSASPYLMLFIKDALAPNTLKSFFLHNAPDHDPNVQVDAIYKHILRKHRLSLEKVLVDASDRNAMTEELHTSWHKWTFSHEMVSFVTSGRMPQLRELGMTMRYRDWHFFLQRLPNMRQLRGLYLPHITSSIHHDRKELALQVLDIVSIRPELKITYVGLETKCYQIVEASSKDTHQDSDESNESGSQPNGGDPSNLDDDNPDVNDDDDDALDDAHDLDGLSTDNSDDDSDTEAEGNNSSRVRFRIQEILYYDDKVSIFKARHGVL